MAVLTEAASGYPVSTTMDPQEKYNRFWAVPALGSGVKEIMAIPHIFLLYFVGIWVSINQLWIWAPVLFTGKYPESGMKLMSGYVRWQMRLTAWFAGLTDKYPPFGFSSGDYAADVAIAEQESYNRFWAIPVVGQGVKTLILIPHLVVVGIMAAITLLAHIIIWIPVLFTGHYPAWGRKLTAGTIAWGARVQAYYYGLTDKYPPFSMAL